MNLNCSITAIITLIFFNIIVASSVPLDEPIYDFLERMETLGIVERVFDGTKPFSREQVAQYLLQIASQKQKLTDIDRRRLQDFLLDFRWELDPHNRSVLMSEKETWYSPFRNWQTFKADFKRFFQRNVPEEENHVFFWERETDNFYFDYHQGVTYEKRNDDSYRSASWQSYNFRGVIKRNFSYFFRMTLMGVRGNDSTYMFEHPILKNSFTQLSDDQAAYSDRSEGEITFQTKYLDFRFAQQSISWGYGESGKLILSDYAEPYPYLSFSWHRKWFSFMALHGKLLAENPDTLENGLIIYPDKWLAAHRLEVYLGRRITLSFNECFVYGNRYAEWSYLFPFNFYRAVQHKLRDRDNATISLDMEYIIYPGFKTYATIFLDEFRRKKLGTNWFGNKHAFSCGLVWFDPLKIHNFSVRFEYTAIMPWVYTHKYLINAYTSDRRSLGHWAGPNSEVIYLHLQKDWHARFRTGLKLQQYKHGDNYPDENIGGDILAGHSVLLGNQTEPRQTRRFLEGILTRKQSGQLYFDYEIFNDFFIKGKWTYQNYNNEIQQEWAFELLFKY